MEPTLQRRLNTTTGKYSLQIEKACVQQLNRLTRQKKIFFLILNAIFCKVSKKEKHRKTGSQFLSFTINQLPMYQAKIRNTVLSNKFKTKILHFK